MIVRTHIHIRFAMVRNIVRPWSTCSQQLLFGLILLFSPTSWLSFSIHHLFRKWKIDFIPADISCEYSLFSILYWLMEPGIVVLRLFWNFPYYTCIYWNLTTKYCLNKIYGTRIHTSTVNELGKNKTKNTIQKHIE